MQNRTEIVYVIPRPEIGGAEKQLLRLIEHLDQRRYRSTVICLDGGGTLLPDYVAIADDVIVLDRQGLFDFRTFIDLLSHIRHIRPTTVHTTLYIANLFGGWAAKLAGVPRVVVSQRGLGIDPRHGKLKRVVHAILNGFIGTFADVRTVNSRAIADRMADHGWTDCQVIYNGINPDQFMLPNPSQIRHQMRKELGPCWAICCSLWPMAASWGPTSSNPRWMAC